MEAKSIKEQIAELKWEDFPCKHESPRGVDSWFAKSAMGQLSIGFNNIGLVWLRLRSVTGSGVLLEFKTLEEAKIEAQEWHNKAVMQFFVS